MGNACIETDVLQALYGEKQVYIIFILTILLLSK